MYLIENMFFFRKKYTVFKLGGGKIVNVNSQKQKLKSWWLRKKREMNCCWNWRQETHPGHVHCQMHKLWNALETKHTPFQGIQHHHGIFFQTGIKLLDNYIKQTLYLPHC